MKYIYTVVLIIISSFVYGQKTQMSDHIVINENFIAKPGEVYIDTVKVNIGKTIFHDNNIQKVDHYFGEKSKIYSAKGATLITRKKSYEFISLPKFISDFKNKKEELKEETVVEILVNGTLIENITDYVIELNPDIKISVNKYSDDGVHHSKKKSKSEILIDTKK